MANSKSSQIIEILEDEEDAEFLCQLEAAEAHAISLSSPSSVKRRRLSVEETNNDLEEGAYTAALKGSKSLTWQKQQQQQQIYATTKTSDLSVGPVIGGGGGCFRCGKEGHWARECPQVMSSAAIGGPTVSPLKTNTIEAEKLCTCGLGNCLLLTANTERNRGRKFFRCPVSQENGGCGFFEWCDEPSRNNISNEGERACKNGGQQQYYQYSTNQSMGYGSAFQLGFRTAISISLISELHVEFLFLEDLRVICALRDEAASVLTKSWDEFDKGTSPPNSSYGQKFESTENKGYNMRSDSSCFKCGQQGHWAKDCLTSTSNSTVGTKTSSNAISGASGTSCFKCGQPGHWAKDCLATASNLTAGARTPSSAFAGAGAGAGARGNSSSDGCYKCGMAGHWARDCSQIQSTKLRNW